MLRDLLYVEPRKKLASTFTFLNKELQLLQAAKEGNFDEIQKIVKDRTPWQVDINTADGDNETALTMMVRQRNLEAVKFLVQNGANVNHRIGSPYFDKNEGTTPLMLAAERNALAIANLLLIRQSDVNATNDKGETALMRAARNGHYEMVELLLDAGADKNIVLHIKIDKSIYKESQLFGTTIVHDNVKHYYWTACSLALSYHHFDVARLIDSEKAEKYITSLNEKNEKTKHSAQQKNISTYSTASHSLLFSKDLTRRESSKETLGAKTLPVENPQGDISTNLKI